MALALYLNTSIFPINVNTEDLSGGLPTTVSIGSGDAFVGDTADPLVVSALARGLVRLLQADPGNLLAAAGLKPGTSCSEAASPLLSKMSSGPATIALTSGNNQTDTAGAVLAAPFVVTVTNAKGLAVAGVTVAWSVTAGGGSLSATSTATNGSGQASVTLTLGAVAGTNTVTASASGASGALSGSPVTFTATGT